MNRSEQILISYFDDKNSYPFWKIANSPKFETAYQGFNNSMATLFDKEGFLACIDGKPSAVKTGKTYRAQEGRPIYDIEWMLYDHSTQNFMYHRPIDEGPAAIRACIYGQKLKLLTFSYFVNGKGVNVGNAAARADDFNKHAKTHKAATRVPYDEWTREVSTYR